MSKENQIEDDLVRKLTDPEYIYRPEIVDTKTLEQNFRNKFETLNRVRLTDNEFLRPGVPFSFFTQIFMVNKLRLTWEPQ